MRWIETETLIDIGEDRWGMDAPLGDEPDARE